MEEKVFIINKSGEKLIGLKTIPSKKKIKNKTAVLVHGFGFYKEEDGMFDDLAKILSEQEYLVYRFDFSGCGESEGDFINATLTKLVSDLNEIINYVKSESDVDASKIVIISQSFGTCTTIALNPEANCMVMLGSFANARTVLADNFGDGFNPHGISEKRRRNGAYLRIKETFWNDLSDYKIDKLVKEIHCPILFIHGDKDPIVSLSEMEILYSNANEPKTKVIIKNADHGMRPKREEMYDNVMEWLSANLV